MPPDVSIEGHVEQEAPDKNCYTLPNGECVSDKTCMHRSATEATNIRDEERRDPEHPAAIHIGTAMVDDRRQSDRRASA